MYSQQLVKLIDARKNILRIFWLIVPFEVLLFTTLAFFLKSQIEIKEPLFDLTYFLIITVILSFAGVFSGSFIASMMFKKNPDFEQQTQKFSSAHRQSEILNSLSNSEKVVLLAYHRNFILLVAAQALLTFPLIFGLLVAILAKNTLFSTIAAVLILLAWKALIPAPDDFNRRFHQSVDPQFEEFQRKQSGS